MAAGVLLSMSAGFAQTSGTTGSLIWSLNGGTLTISGTGSMMNYNHGTAPWSSYCTSIANVEITEGVTTIGNAAFSWWG